MKYSKNITVAYLFSRTLVQQRCIKQFLFAAAIIFVITNLQTAHAEINLDSNFSLTPSIRFDDYDWRSSGGVGVADPNKGYDLDWRNMTIYQLNLGSAIIFNDFIYAKSTAGFGVIASGDNQISELDANNNNSLIARSINDAGDGEVYDISIAIGALFRIVDRGVNNTLLLIPQIGYSVHKQNLHMKNGRQAQPISSPISGLNSSYESQWDGPWAGIDLRFEATTTSALQLRYEYHIADYFADANFNLDNTLANPLSLSQNADATGSIFALGWREEFNDNWFMGLEFVTQRWTTDGGTNRVFRASGAAYETQLDKVNWRSTSVNLTISRFFVSR